MGDGAPGSARKGRPSGLTKAGEAEGQQKLSGWISQDQPAKKKTPQSPIDLLGRTCPGRGWKYVQDALWVTIDNLPKEVSTLLKELYPEEDLARYDMPTPSAWGAWSEEQNKTWIECSIKEMEKTRAKYKDLDGTPWYKEADYVLLQKKSLAAYYARSIDNAYKQFKSTATEAKKAEMGEYRLLLA